MNTKIKNILMVLIILILCVGVWLFFMQEDDARQDLLQEMTLSEAAKMGEKTTHKLLIQIEPPKSEGRLERGDVVMVAAADREFSDAEKEGFLIIKMELTEKQGKLLSLAMQEKTKEKDEQGNPIYKDVKRRKFAVDLKKIGVGDEVVRGRVMEDKVFMWDALYQKEKKQNE